MDHPKFILSNQKEGSIDIQRVKYWSKGRIDFVFQLEVSMLLTYKMVSSMLCPVHHSKARLSDWSALPMERKFNLLARITGVDKQKNLHNIVNIFLPVIFLVYVFGAQKNRLIERVLLSTHNKCYG